MKTEANENSRYERQMLLPGIGEEGQKKLRQGSVLVIGAGGLGSPALLYLVGAGVGKIGIVDADEISISNLHRQILYAESDVGKNKALAAKEHLEKLNTEVSIQAYPLRITEENIAGLVDAYDFVLDAVDNFETKYLINDTCVKLKKPFCHGGVLRFQGQAMTYVPGRGPCYSCVFPKLPEHAISCAQAGVIGTNPGVIGCIQATEAVKYLTGVGELLIGKLYEIDLLDMESMIIPLANCRPCSLHAENDTE